MKLIWLPFLFVCCLSTGEQESAPVQNYELNPVGCVYPNGSCELTPEEYQRQFEPMVTQAGTPDPL